MPVNAFLKFGDIEGETQNEQHPKHIEIESFSWSGSHSGTVESGGGLSSGKAMVGDLQLTKKMDKSSPKLQLACCTGAPVPEAYLVVDRAGTAPTPYLKVTLADAVISSYNVTTAGGDMPYESLSLSYTKVTIGYIPVDKEGNPQGAIEAVYDLKTSEAE
jgi:type VI secretion system secreted protein Hcp